MTYTAAGHGYINAEVARHIDEVQIFELDNNLQQAISGDNKQEVQRVAQEIERKGNLGRRGMPIASQPRSAHDLERARLRSVASANASSLEELDELYSVSNGAAVGEMVAQFGGDRRRRRGNAGKIELGFYSAR